MIENYVVIKEWLVVGFKVVIVGVDDWLLFMMGDWLEFVCKLVCWIVGECELSDGIYVSYG